MMREYYTDVWNFVDWVSIVVGFSITFYWLWMVAATEQLAKDIISLPRAPLRNRNTTLTASAGPSVDTTTVANSRMPPSPQIFEDMETYFFYDGLLRIALFFCTSVLMLRFFKNFKTQPRLEMLQKTMTKALQDVLHFMVIFILMYSNCAVGGYVLFGSYIWEWSSPLKAFNTTFRALVGNCDFHTMYQVHPFGCSFWLGFFILCYIFLFVNIVFAFMYESYTSVLVEVGHTMGIFGELKKFTADVAWNWQRQWESLKQRQWASDPYSGALEMVANMGPENVTDKHRRANSVLAEKSARMKRQTVATVEDNLREVEEDPHISVEMLMSELGLEEEAAQHLVDQAKENIKEDMDPLEADTWEAQRLISLLVQHRRAIDNACSSIEEEADEAGDHLVDDLDILQVVVLRTLQDIIAVREKGVKGALAPPPRTHKMLLTDGTSPAAQAWQHTVAVMKKGSKG